MCAVVKLEPSSVFDVPYSIFGVQFYRLKQLYPFFAQVFRDALNSYPLIGGVGLGMRRWHVAESILYAKAPIGRGRHRMIHSANQRDCWLRMYT